MLFLNQDLLTKRATLMKTRNWLILLAIVIAIPVGWYLISPLFINKTVSEKFPTIQATEAMEEKDDMVSEDTMAEDEMMGGATQAMEEAMAEPTKEMTDPIPEEDAATMTILFQGEFYNIAHEGMGTATIYQLADGSRILRFKNFEVLNGPDLHVYLATQDPVPDTVGIELEGSIDLGELKGNIGDQNYEIPAELDLSQFHSVVIWCVPFRVPFNAAPLRLPAP
jgi:hypothetical protein